MKVISRALGAVLAVSICGLWVPAARAAVEDIIPAIILKVEGDGVAHVRKKSGVVESAGASGKVFVGDRVITDTRSAVHLMLNDGSVIKVGFNSEFILEKVENKKRYLSWIFRLLHGRIRALVEKVPAKETHLRIETESGTIGVRGTEFVLESDGAGSSLFLLEGLVSFGKMDCEKTKSCVDVKTGEGSAITKGAAKPAAPAAYTVRDLFGLANPTTPGPAIAARISLFRDARHVQEGPVIQADEKALKKIVDESTTELAAAQDRAIGRSKEQRDAMHEAVKNGTYEITIAAADSYAASQTGFIATSNGGAENLVAQVAASKFRLGEAVRKADAAGLFLDSGSGPEDGSATRTYKLRKTLDFDQSAVAKADRDALTKATEDYKDTLAYVEALSGDQVSSGDKPSKPGTGSGKGGGGNAEPEAPNFDSDAGKQKKVAPCDSACEASRIAHEAEVASEGSVTAFANVADPTAASDGTTSKRGRGSLPGSVRTRFFRRTVAGNSCFKSQSKCTMQPCSGFSKGKRCKAGETVEVCDTKQVPVRCNEK